jgi:hypothetical protein
MRVREKGLVFFFYRLVGDAEGGCKRKGWFSFFCFDISFLPAGWRRGGGLQEKGLVLRLAWLGGNVPHRVAPLARICRCSGQ